MATLGGVLAEQVLYVHLFARDKRLRGPMLVVWVAIFGGGLHAPVTVFYYKELGLGPKDIGVLSFVVSLGVYLSPAYGLVQDKLGGFVAMGLAAAFCTLGCLVRGLATGFASLLVGCVIIGLGASNLGSTVLSHVSTHTAPERRSQVIAVFLTQTATLAVVGKALYPAWNYVLEDIVGVRDTLTRYRVHMGVCTFFCVFGTVRLLAARQHIAGSAAPKADPIATEGAACDDSETGSDDGEGRDGGPAGGPPGRRLHFAVLTLPILFQSVARVTVSLVWPLFVADRFGWGTVEFAWVLFASSLLSSLSVACYPTAERVVGRHVGGAALLLAAGVALVAFLPGAATRACVATHLAATSLLVALLAFAEPPLKSAASLYAAPHAQAQAFASINTISGFGEQVGSLGSSWLYHYSRDWGGLPVGAHGSLPLIVSAGLLLMGAVITLTHAAASVSRDGHGRTEEQDMAAVGGAGGGGGGSSGDELRLLSRVKRSVE